MSIKRPKAGETEEDLMAFQDKFLQERRVVERKQTLDPPASFQPNNVRMARKNLMESPDGPWTLSTSTPSSSDTAGHRSRLRAVQPQLVDTSTILFDIAEKNIGHDSFEFIPKDSSKTRYTGFPEVLEGVELTDDTKTQMPKRSLFRQQVDGGNIVAGPARSHQASASNRMCSISEAVEIDRENAERLKQMSAVEISAEQKRLLQIMDPELINFLRNRKQKKQQLDAPVSSIVQPSSTKAAVPKMEQTTKEQEQRTLEEAIRNLEVLPIPANSEEISALKPKEHKQKFAADPISLDLASRMAQSSLGKKMESIVRLFDSLESSSLPTKSHYNLQSVRKSAAPMPSLDDLWSADELTAIATEKMDHIRRVYMRKDPTDNKWHFKDIFDPISDPLWLLKPINDIFFAVAVGGAKLDDHLLDTVTYAVLFSCLVLQQRPTYFAVCFTPADIYCRLAQLYLLGPAVYFDPVIYNLLGFFLKAYLLPECSKGRFSVDDEDVPVGGFNSFLPLYQDVMTEFENGSSGDRLFTHYLLLPAYANANRRAAVRLRLQLWETETKAALLRAVHLSTDKCLIGMDQMISTDEFSRSSLVAYAQAIKLKLVTPSRNPLLYTIARQSIENFLYKALNGEFGDDDEDVSSSLLETLQHAVQ